MDIYPRGSEWRRWDFHMHTPETKKNCQFEGRTLEDQWNKFYDNIQTYVGDGSDPSRNVVAIGITDYLSIDNYVKVVADHRLPASIKFIFPNIEMRMNPIVRNNGTNIHFLFDPEIVDQLDDIFFSKLTFNFNGEDYTATKSSLIKLGKKFDSQITDDAIALKAGIEQFIPDFSKLQHLFTNNPTLKDHSIVVVSNSSNDGASGVTKHSDYLLENNVSQLDATRRSIYHFTDAIFSNNTSDVDYFLGKSRDNAEDVIKKCGSLKPCISGCDAHKNKDILKPNNDKFCWIKSNPDFNGMLQMLYEPAERVRIQQLQPQVKPDYLMIKSVKIEDENFLSSPILFNDKLTCIIGGKSTGKSLLLHNLALTIDAPQVEKKCKIYKLN